jgi:hypothetical protein
VDGLSDVVLDPTNHGGGIDSGRIRCAVALADVHRNAGVCIKSEEVWVYTAVCGGDCEIGIFLEVVVHFVLELKAAPSASPLARVASLGQYHRHVHLL